MTLPLLPARLENESTRRSTLSSPPRSSLLPLPRQVSDLTRKIDVQIKRAQRVEEELAQSEKRLKELEGEHAGSAETIATLEAKVAEGGAFLANVTNQLSAAKSELLELQAAREAAEGAAEDARQEAARASSDGAAEILALQTRLEEVEASAADSARAYEAEISRLGGNISNLENQLEAANLALEEAGRPRTAPPPPPEPEPEPEPEPVMDEELLSAVVACMGAEVATTEEALAAVHGVVESTARDLAEAREALEVSEREGGEARMRHELTVTLLDEARREAGAATRLLAEANGQLESERSALAVAAEARARLEAQLRESEEKLETGQREVAEQKEALDARIAEAAAAADRAARMEAEPCKREVVKLAKLLRQEASRWGLAPPTRRRSKEVLMDELIQVETLTAELGLIDGELHEAVESAKAWHAKQMRTSIELRGLQSQAEDRAKAYGEARRLKAEIEACTRAVADALAPQLSPTQQLPPQPPAPPMAPPPPQHQLHGSSPRASTQGGRRSRGGGRRQQDHNVLRGLQPKKPPPSELENRCRELISRHHGFRDALDATRQKLELTLLHLRSLDAAAATERAAIVHAALEALQHMHAHLASFSSGAANSTNVPRTVRALQVANCLPPQPIHRKAWHEHVAPGIPTVQTSRVAGTTAPPHHHHDRARPPNSSPEGDALQPAPMAQLQPVPPQPSFAESDIAGIDEGGCCSSSIGEGGGGGLVPTCGSGSGSGSAYGLGLSGGGTSGDIGFLTDHAELPRQAAVSLDGATGPAAQHIHAPYYSAVAAFPHGAAAAPARPPLNSRGVISAGHPTTQGQAALVGDAAPLLPYREEEWVRAYGGSLSARETGEPRRCYDVSFGLPSKHQLPLSPRTASRATADARQWGARGAFKGPSFAPSAKRAMWHALRPPEQRASRAIADLALGYSAGAPPMSARANVYVHPAERNAASLFDPSTRGAAGQQPVDDGSLAGTAPILPPLVAAEGEQLQSNAAVDAVKMSSTQPNRCRTG